MTDRHPELDPDLLADLDAGLLDADRSARLRAAAAADPRASAVLAALAATRSELAALPDPPIPPSVAARWDAALAAEAARSTPGGNTGPHRYVMRPPRKRAPRPRAGRTRSRSPYRRPALAAAVLAAVVAGALWESHDPVPSLDRVDLAAVGRAAIGATDVGELADPDRRAACLRAVALPGVAPDAPLLGGRRVEIDGHPAVLLVLGTGALGRFLIAVVDNGCGPDGGTLLRSAVAGR